MPLGLMPFDLTPVDLMNENVTPIHGPSFDENLIESLILSFAVPEFSGPLNFE